LLKIESILVPFGAAQDKIGKIGSAVAEVIGGLGDVASANWDTAVDLGKIAES